MTTWITIIYLNSKRPTHGANKWDHKGFRP